MTHPPGSSLYVDQMTLSSTNRALAMCFEAWATVVGAEERRLEQMRPFANMLRARLLTQVYNAWADYAGEAELSAEEAVQRCVAQGEAAVQAAWATPTA